MIDNVRTPSFPLALPIPSSPSFCRMANRTMDSQFQRPLPPRPVSTQQPPQLYTRKDGTASKAPFTQVQVLRDGSMRFFYSDNTTTTFQSSRPPTCPNPNQQLSERPQGRPFSPFGIPAEFTRARYNEICHAFVNPTLWCTYGSKCHRIHPLDRETYRQKIRDALAIPITDSVPEPSQEKEKEKVLEPTKHDITAHSSTSDTNKASPDKQITGYPGWDTDGSWMGVSGAETYTSVSTTSPATSNDRLSSVSSGSSSPVSESPILSDDDYWEDLPPKPTPVQARGNTVCVMYRKGGKCPRGNNCLFKHVLDAVVPSSEPPEGDSAPPPILVLTPPPGLTAPATNIPTSSILKSSDKALTSPVTPSRDENPAPSRMISHKKMPVGSAVSSSRAKTPVSSVASSSAKTFISSAISPSTKSSISSTVSPSSKSSASSAVPPSSKAPAPSLPAKTITPHPAMRLPERPTSSKPGIGHFRPKSTQICIKWSRGVCPYGHGCRFMHGDLKYDSESVNLPPPIANDDFLLSVKLHQYMRVQCSAGLEIQRIQTAFESSTLLVSNISPRVHPKRLEEMLSSYGLVEEIWMPSFFSAHTVVKVVYSDTAEAQKAQSALSGTKMYDLTITAKVANSGSAAAVTNALLKDTAIRISFEAPAKEVYAGYSNRADAERAIQIARESPLNGHYLKGEVYEGMPAVDVVNVRFSGVPINVDKADVVRFINPVDFMWTRPNYEGLENTFTKIKYRLREFDLESVEFLPPPYRDGGMVRAWANFPNPSKAKEAARRLDGWMPKWTGQTQIRATHFKSLSYRVSQEKWDKAGAGIDILQASHHGRRTSVHVSVRDVGGRFVRLAGDDQKELAHLKNQFEQILTGEIVRCDGKNVYDSYFAAREGEEFMRDLSMKNPSVYFEHNAQRSHIILHGYVVDRVRFANAIINKVKELRSQKKYEIRLPGRLYGAVINDARMRNMQKLHGLDNAQLDIQRRMLYVRGSPDLYQQFKRMVDDIEQRIPKAVAYEGPICPICFDRPSSPIHLPCGDVWCRECITNYFQSGKEQKTFPLKCLGKEGRCGTKIPISAVKQVLTWTELEEVIGAAFSGYVNARPKEYHYCLTPDCPQIYRCTQQKGTLQCPMCLSSICTRCHREAHDEMQCSDQVQDDLFKKWVKEHDVKQCPTCDVPIEKIEGCHHMTCTRCQTHICWQCLKTFPGGEGIYGHMREVHGTFGLGPVFD